MSATHRQQRDLTRWNRAGLSRVQYVDANAAVFLEHLRAAMIARFLRGVAPAEDGRQADFWFDLMKGAEATAVPAGVLQAYKDGVDWQALLPGLAQTPETRAARNRRLEDNYHAQSEDYAAETLRAFARASHILAGYVDAYVNEGYLATATQWASLHKLGQMVNYAPAAAASASDVVALIAGPGTGAATVATGLAMSTPPPGGGAPLVFETLEEITTHPDLNGARTRNHDLNLTECFTPRCRFVLGKAAGPAPGMPVLIGLRHPIVYPDPVAGVVATAETDAAGESVEIVLEGTAPTGYLKAYVELRYGPERSDYALPVPDADTLYLRVSGDTGFEPGSLVEFEYGEGVTAFGIVTSWDNDRLGLKVDLLGGSAADLQVTKVRALVPYPFDRGFVDLAPDAPFESILSVYFVASGRIESQGIVLAPLDIDDVASGLVYVGNDFVFLRYQTAPGTTWAGVRDDAIEWVDVTVITHPPFITAALSDPETIVTFRGKPPKSLAVGSYYLARRQNDAHVALRVEGLRVDKDEYSIAFDRDPGGEVHKILFMGPLKTALSPVDHDRDPGAITDGAGRVRLAGLAPEAIALLRIGKRVLIEDERAGAAAPLSTTIAEVIPQAGPGQVRLALAGGGADLARFTAGWTLFRLNAVPAGHGEAKGSKTLGSGNGEKPRQTLPFDVKDVSFVADARAAAGVVPDIDVRVDGMLWDYADLTDPAAEDTASYSIRPRADGTMEIVFRRRLPSGRNNIAVSRHRVGVGAKGNGLGPGAFLKPKSKHRIVEKIVQPFATAGGGDRESAASIRETAGAAIAANDRAVALEDFARLVRRHSGVWDANAREILDGGRTGLVEITVVPVGGGALGTLGETLATFLKARILPGTRTRILGFTALPVTLTAHIRADLAQWPEDVLREACVAALTGTFALSARRLGQSLYVSEVLAALEGVTGVETATASLALPAGASVSAEQVFTSESGETRAIYPAAAEVAFLAGAQDIDLTIGGLG